MNRQFAIYLVLGLAAFGYTPESRAEAPDFGICEGKSGAAWGLCRAGVAAGCADDSGNSRACREIEDQYTDVTGEVPPWDAPPPATCPCDFTLVPKTNPPWSPGASDPIQFTCPLAADGGRDVLITDRHVQAGTHTEVLYFFEPGLLFHGCHSYLDGIKVEEDIYMSEAEQAACQSEAIAYGQALKAVLGAEVDDACSPLLP
ncbi:MAG: hypothetical protein HKN58_02315 [Xanthomonadales bacterium]|nr:hypothetical protein [Xanthomonadales bacterium]